MGQQSLKPPGLAGETVPTSRSKTGKKRKLLTLENFRRDGEGVHAQPQQNQVSLRRQHSPQSPASMASSQEGTYVLTQER